MTETAPTKERQMDWLFSPEKVASFLSRHVPFDGAEHGAPHTVRIERCWPVGDTGLLIEWSFALRSGDRFRLYGQIVTQEPQRREGIGTQHPFVEHGMLRGVLVYLPEWSFVVHSPDCDPGLSTLNECLDSDQMGRSLTQFALQAGLTDGWLHRPPRCRLLGYRPGRRAAIAYEWTDSKDTTLRVFAKLLKGGRGEQLLQVHHRLNLEFSGHSDSSVRVASPIGYLSNLDLALFEWAVCPGSAHQEPLKASDAPRIVNALIALHRTSTQDLKGFSISDDRRIIGRWQRHLFRWYSGMASEAEPLHDAVMEFSERVRNGQANAIHGDFYERQFTLGRHTITLFDLDTIKRGDVCVDLGNLLAHLLLLALRDGDSAHEFKQAACSLIGKYGSRSQLLDYDALTYYWASTLLRLGAVHAQRTATRQYVPALWKQARDLLKHGSLSFLNGQLHGERGIGAGGHASHR